MREEIFEITFDGVRIGLWYNKEEDRTELLMDNLEASTKEKRETTESKMLFLKGKVERIQ